MNDARTPRNPGRVIPGVLRRFIGVVSVVSALALASGACSDSDTVSGPPHGQSPTPTPGPAATIAGDWTGTFSTSDSADCHSDPDAHASFTQDGILISGTISTIANTCGFGGSFAGRLDGEGLTGTLSKATYADAVVTGTATASSIHLHVRDFVHDNGNGSGQVIPGGSLDLHR